MEFDRAFAVFFGVNSVEEMVGKEMPEEHMGLMNEWFVFDYKHTNGKTTLENYLLENKQRLTSKEIELLDSLLNTSRYGMFEVKKVDVGKGVDLYELQSGNVYKVKERNATYSLHKGDVFPMRIGLVNGQWEMVGASSAAWPLGLQEGARNFFKGANEHLSPKDIFHLLSPANNSENFYDVQGDEKLTAEAAKTRLEELLRLYGLNKIVSVGVIDGWCRDVGAGQRTPTEVLSLVAGLAGESIALRDLDALTKAAMDFYNTRPQKRLFGKSPQEKILEVGLGSKGFLTDVAEIGGKKLLDMVMEAHEAMGKNEYFLAVDKFNEAFKILLEQKTAKPDIYRLFANAAIAQFGTGLEMEGKILLEKSLELNPNYDFALMTKEKYERGEFEPLISHGMAGMLQKQRLERWDFAAIRKEWSDDKILEQLSEFGISTTKKDFLAQAKKYFFTEDLSEAEFYHKYKGPDDWNEDFVWMAAYTLWERWGTELPAHDILENAFSDLFDLLFEDYDCRSSIEDALSVMKKYLTISNQKFVAVWKNSNHYVADITQFMETSIELLGTKNRREFLSIAEGFHRLTGDNFWQLTAVIDRIVTKENGWQSDLAEFLAEFPYSPLPFLLTAGVFANEENIGQTEYYLLQALEVVQKRGREHPKNLSYHAQEFLDDHNHVLSTLEDFYSANGAEDKLKEIRTMLAEVKRQQEEEDTRPERMKETDRFEEMINQVTVRRMADQPAMKYYEYLQGLGVNFKTDELTTSKILIHGLDGRRKIGRNDPCCCGSGKKYKKCHGKN